MSWPALQEIDAQVQQLAEQVHEGNARVWQLTGDLSAGKTTTLKRLHTLFLKSGKRSILLDPPVGELDAGVTALAQLASQLGNGAPQRSEVDNLIRNQSLTFDEKLTQVKVWLDGINDLVVLCDEPDEWLPRLDSLGSFREPFQRLLQTLFQAPTVKLVVTGKLPHPTTARSLHLSWQSDARSWLGEKDSWGRFLAPAALRLRNALVHDALSCKSPLELRLMVGLVAMGKDPKGLADLPRRTLAKAFLARVREDDRWSTLEKCWQRISLLRESFDEETLSSFKAPSADAESGQLLRNCLLFREAGKLVLHELLRDDVQSYLELDVKRELHNEWVTFYVSKVETMKNWADRPVLTDFLRSEIEAYYHQCYAGPETASSLAPFFIEQLKMSGRVLSKDYKMYSVAADIFERAVQWDDNDDYSHHYLAYNYDVQGLEAKKVEQHYRRAIELRHDHPWWWARWIKFLISRGRTEEAERAWFNARDALAPDIRNWDSMNYQRLHGRVLETALARSLIYLSQTILQDIPQGVLSRDQNLLALESRFIALKRAREGRAVVPFPHASERWWGVGPYLLPLEMNGKKLVDWYAGYVENLESETVEIIAGEVNPQVQEEPDIESLEFEKHVFLSWLDSGESLQSGDFIELGVYGEEEAIYRVKIHSRRLAALERVPNIFPDPDRYLVAH